MLDFPSFGFKDLEMSLCFYQFSEESVSSFEPSLSVSIFLRWWKGLQGELILGEWREGKFAGSLLELAALAMESPETWAILKKRGKVCRWPRLTQAGKGAYRVGEEFAGDNHPKQQSNHFP